MITNINIPAALIFVFSRPFYYFVSDEIFIHVTRAHLRLLLIVTLGDKIKSIITSDLQKYSGFLNCLGFY